MRRAAWAPVAFLAALVACTGDLAVPTEPLRLLRTEWAVAYVGEPFEGALRPTGGLRPYRFELADGVVPPGLALEAGRLVGTPTTVGRYTFTVKVQDGNLSQTLQQLDLDVRPLPTPIVRVDAPATELRGDVPLTVRVEDARGWRGARVALTWDPDAFELVAGPTASDARLAVFTDVAEGRAWIEAAALGPTRDGAFALARFTLRPLAPPTRHAPRLGAPVEAPRPRSLLAPSLRGARRGRASAGASALALPPDQWRAMAPRSTPVAALISSLVRMARHAQLLLFGSSGVSLVMSMTVSFSMSSGRIVEVRSCETSSSFCMRRACLALSP